MRVSYTFFGGGGMISIELSNFEIISAIESCIFNPHIKCYNSRSILATLYFS